MLSCTVLLVEEYLARLTVGISADLFMFAGMLAMRDSNCKSVRVAQKSDAKEQKSVHSRHV